MNSSKHLELRCLLTQPDHPHFVTLNKQKDPPSNLSQRTLIASIISPGTPESTAPSRAPDCLVPRELSAARRRRGASYAIRKQLKCTLSESNMSCIYQRALQPITVKQAHLLRACGAEVQPPCRFINIPLGAGDGCFQLSDGCGRISETVCSLGAGEIKLGKTHNKNCVVRLASLLQGLYYEWMTRNWKTHWDVYNN